MFKKLLIIPAIVLMSQGVFADDHGRPPQDYEQRYDESRGYDQPQQGYDEGYYPPQAPCCGGVYVPPPAPPCCEVVPPPPPPPVVYNPGINYYCGAPQCAPLAVPYGPALRPYPRPYYGGFGPRPYPNGGPIAGFPRGMMRRMSATGCEVKQGNNGEFTLLSAEGEVLYHSNIKGADVNADFIKAHHEKTSDLCGGVRSPAKSLDI